MTVGDIMFALTIAITIGMILWSWVMASFIDNTSKTLKDIQDNQFDAEQVMKLYEMKYTRPVIMQERADIKVLMTELEIPREVCKAIEEGRFNMEYFVMRELSNNFREYIKPYIEYSVEDNMPRMSKVVKGRLRVVSKNN